MRRLRDLGIQVMVLSGDNAAAARALAGRAGVAASNVTAGVGPGGKVDFVEQLKRGGAVRCAGPQSSILQSALTTWKVCAGLLYALLAQHQARSRLRTRDDSWLDTWGARARTSQNSVTP